MLVRPATLDDAAACAAIYAPYVTDSAVSFEEEPPSAEELARRIETSIAWLVLEAAAGETGPGEGRCSEAGSGRVVGYAYAATFHPRAAYRWACEVSVYLEPGRRRTGGGRALYDVLLPQLAERGYRTAIAGMTLPNDASAGLHAALGFEPVGTYRRVGYKFGTWHDVAWTQLMLAEGDETPVEPH
jgi:phosphinothricin acetyltransferase